MPLGTSTSNRRFASIKNGKISVYTGKGNPYQEANSLEGQITGLSIQTETFQDQDYEVLIVNINDNENEWQLKTRFDSGYARGILFALPNVNPSEWVRFSPSMSEDKKKSTTFLNQNGKALKWFYTKETPNGLPPMKKMKVNKKDVWDKTDQLDFLKNAVVDFNKKLGKPVHVDNVSNEEEMPF